MTRSYDVLPPPLSLPRDPERHDAGPASQRSAILALAAGTAADAAWGPLLEYLIALGRTDVPLARLTEGHVDAMRILHQAGSAPVPDAAYAVWASRSQATGLAGRRDGRMWVLDGTLRFASGAGVVDRALVPVWLDTGTHVLLDLEVKDWTFDTGLWRTRAMEQSRSHQVSLSGHRVEAAEVGQPDFYLDRPGFFPGGAGVAAVWTGGAGRVVDLLSRAVPEARRTEAQVARFGRARIDLATAAAVVRDSAPRLADGPVEQLRITSTYVRSGVAQAVRRIAG